MPTGRSAPPPGAGWWSERSPSCKSKQYSGEHHPIILVSHKRDSKNGVSWDNLLTRILVVKTAYRPVRGILLLGGGMLGGFLLVFSAASFLLDSSPSSMQRAILG